MQTSDVLARAGDLRTVNRLVMSNPIPQRVEVIKPAIDILTPVGTLACRTHGVHNVAS